MEFKAVIGFIIALCLLPTLCSAWWTDDTTGEEIIISSEYKDYPEIGSFRMKWKADNPSGSTQHCDFFFLYDDTKIPIQELDTKERIIEEVQHEIPIEDCSEALYCPIEDAYYDCEVVGYDYVTIPEVRYVKLDPVEEKTSSDLLPTNIKDKFKSKKKYKNLKLEKGETRIFETEISGIKPFVHEGEIWIVADCNGDAYGALDPWYGGGSWTSKRPFNMSCGGSFSDYPLQVTINASEFGTLNVSDIRILNSSEDGLVPFEYEEEEAGGMGENSTFFINGTCGNEYWFYWNNSASETSASDCSEVWSWCDEFERADNLTVGGGFTEVDEGGGNANITDGILYIPDTSGANDIILKRSLPTLSGFRAIGRSQSDDLNDAFNFLWFYDNIDIANQFTFLRFENDDIEYRTSAGASKVADATVNTWHRSEIRVNDTSSDSIDEMLVDNTSYVTSGDAFAARTNIQALKIATGNAGTCIGQLDWGKYGKWDEDLNETTTWGVIQYYAGDVTAPDLDWNWTNINFTTGSTTVSNICVNASEAVNCTLIFNGTRYANATSATNICIDLSGLGQGNYSTINFTCDDAAGNNANTTDAWTTVDTSAPSSVSISNPANNTNTSSSKTTLTITCTDAHSWCENTTIYYANNDSEANDSCTSATSCDFHAPAEATFVLYARSADNATPANTGQSDNFTLTYDATPPVLTWDAWTGRNASTTANSTTISLTTNEVALNCTFYVNGSVYHNTTTASAFGQNLTNFAAGNYSTINATCRDPAGNKGDSSNVWWDAGTGISYNASIAAGDVTFNAPAEEYKEVYFNITWSIALGDTNASALNVSVTENYSECVAQPAATVDWNYTTSQNGTLNSYSTFRCNGVSDAGYTFNLNISWTNDTATYTLNVTDTIVIPQRPAGPSSSSSSSGTDPGAYPLPLGGTTGGAIDVNLNVGGINIDPLHLLFVVIVIVFILAVRSAAKNKKK